MGNWIMACICNHRLLNKCSRYRFVLFVDPLQRDGQVLYPLLWTLLQ